MFDIRAEIAGVPVLIRCTYRENADFLRDFATQREERIVIEPGETDLIDAAARLDRMHAHRGEEPRRYRDVYLENTAIHAMLAERLASCGVLLMHGSALCMDGEAYLFTARSGTGKSTHTRLWREVFGDRVWMINDDKPMLRVGEDGITVWGTPWMGKHRLGRNACAPLKAIVSLNRGETNSIRPMSRSEALPVVFRQVYASSDPETMRAITAMEMALLDRAAFYRLACNMDPEAARVAWAGMNP